MLKFCLIDDDEHFHDFFRHLLLCNHLTIDIDFYNSSETFLKVILTNYIHYHVLFLDIEMPFMDGISLSKELRKKKSDMIIIFLSHRSDMIINAFGLNIYKFIPKIEIESVLVNVIDEISDNLFSNKLLEFRVNDKNILLQSDQIISIEVISRKTWIISRCRPNICLNYLSLNNIYKQLDSSIFIFVNRSQIVNVKKIMKIIGTQIFMENDSILYTTPLKKNSVLNLYRKYTYK
ncbi:MAG: response regulator [Erysipelotrichaceae bacterium]